MHKSIWAAAMALGAAGSAQAAPVPAQASQPVLASALDRAKTANSTWSAYLAQSGKCRWGNPTTATILYAEVAMWRDLAALEDKAAADTVKTAYPAFQPCSSPADLDAQGRAVATFWEWTTRLAMWSELAAQPGWGNVLIQIERGSLAQTAERRVAVEKALIEANTLPVMQQQGTALQQEAIAVFHLVCEPRRLVRSKEARACPVIAETMLDQRPAALIRAEAAERTASLLVESARQEQRGVFGQPYHLKTEMLDFDVKCKEGQFVIYPESPYTGVSADFLEVAVQRFAQDGTVERIRVRQSGDGYDLTETVTLNGLQVIPGLARFKMCFP